MLCLEFLKNTTLNIDLGKIEFNGKSVQSIDSCFIEEWDWDTELFGTAEPSENLSEKIDPKPYEPGLCMDVAHFSEKSPKDEHSPLILDNPKLVTNKSDESVKKMPNWSLVCSDW